LVALLVDDLLGAEATVIKPLDGFIRQATGIAGATVGGDGMVRLLIDPGALVADVAEKLNMQARSAHA
jgi:chemotaxis protein histidine kinase CheA